MNNWALNNTFPYFRDQNSKLLNDEDDWSGWSDEKNNWNNDQDNDDDALEAWLNDDSSAKSSKNKLNKKNNKDLDANNWETLDGADKKSLKSSRNAKKKETLISTNDGWDDVDWNDTPTSSSKPKEPLVGNLLDLDINDSQSNKDNMTNDGWDNEVWAEADDDEWQSLDLETTNKRK